MTNEISIRAAQQADISNLVDLTARSFCDTYGAQNALRDVDEYLSASLSQERIQEQFEDSSNIFLVAILDNGDELVGYAMIRQDSNVIEIERLYADNSVIGKGVGAALMSACLERAKSSACEEVWLGVWEQNDRAIRFYERWGFRDVGRKTFRLGSDLQNDLTMSRVP